MKELSNNDMARIVEYVDGTLDEQERAEFELRMSAEPELAAAVEGTLDSDLFLSRMTSDSSGDSQTVEGAAPAPKHTLRPVRSPWWFAALAAAALVLLWVGRDLTRGRGGSRSEFVVATAAGFESPAEYVAATDSLSELVPPGLGVLRGGNPEPNVTAAEFAARSAAAEQDLLDRTSAPRAEPLRAGFFVLPLRLAEEASVLVFALPEEGASARLWPEEEDFAAAAQAARLDARDHVLPRPRIEHFMPDDRLKYHRGFLVPFGARSVRVVIAVRAAELTAEEVEHLDTKLAFDSLPGMEVGLIPELKELGFRVEELRVDEP